MKKGFSTSFDTKSGITESLNIQYLYDNSNRSNISLFLEENECFFQNLQSCFIEEPEKLKNMLIAFSKETIKFKIPYDDSFESFDIPILLTTLLQDSDKKMVFITLYLIAGLAKNSPIYLNLLLSESLHRYLISIITEVGSETKEFLNQRIALIILKFIASESYEWRNKLLASATLNNIAYSVFKYFATDNVIKDFLGYINVLVSYKKIKKDYLIGILDLLTKIKDSVGRNNIVYFLISVKKVSEYEISGKLIESNEELFNFIELSYNDLCIDIVKETSEIICNFIKHGGKLRNSIVSVSLHYINCCDETIFQIASELCIELLMHCLKVEYIEIDLRVLINRATEGTKKTKVCALDLLTYYLLCRNDKMEEALNYNLLEVILDFIESDDTECMIKVISLAKILMTKQDPTSFDVVSAFSDLGGFDTLIDVFDNTENEELKGVIDDLLTAFYNEED